MGSNVGDMPGLTDLLDEQESCKNELLERPFMDSRDYFSWRNRAVKYALGEWPKNGDITISWIFYAPLIKSDPRHNNQTWQMTARQFSQFIEIIFDRAIKEMRSKFTEDRDQRMGHR